jgi:hypothetical protein
MSQEEHRHYQVLKKVTQKDVPPYRFQVFYFTLLTRLLGLTFGMKMLERGEDKASRPTRSCPGRIRSCMRWSRMKPATRNS